MGGYSKLYGKSLIHSSSYPYCKLLLCKLRKIMAQIDTLKRKRATIKASLTRFINSLQDNSENNSPSTLKVKLNSVLPLLDNFNQVQFDIEGLVDQTDASAVSEQENYRVEFENAYFSVVARANDLIYTSNVSITAIESPPARANDEHFYFGGTFLPKQQVPKFNGELNEWVKFRDTFIALIHNNPKLTDIQKFTFLEDALSGSAASAIKSIGISNENYTTAWEKLRTRFEDESELKYHHFRGIFDAPPVTKNSREELQALIDNIENHLAALKTLKEPTQHWDSIIIFVLLHFKLNDYLKREWEKEITPSSSSAISLKQLIDFLQAQCKIFAKK